VNEAVERAHRDGILTTASLMVTGAAAGDAVTRARRLPQLRIGLHLVLVDELPVLPKHRVPDLIDGSGRFRSNMALSGLKLALSRRARDQAAAEIRAQFEAFRATGLPLDHVNAHKHFHVHPVIAALVLRIGREFGARGLRAPVEPANVLNQIEPGSARDGDWLLRLFARRLLRRARQAGLFAPDAIFGIRWSGAMTKQRLLRLIQMLQGATAEIYLHPATSGGFRGSTAGYRYADELAALTDSAVIAAAKADAIRLGGFSDFVPSALCT